MNQDDTAVWLPEGEPAAVCGRTLYELAATFEVWQLVNGREVTYYCRRSCVEDCPEVAR